MAERLPDWAFEGGVCVCIKVGAWVDVWPNTLQIKRAPVIGEVLTISHIVPGLADEGWFLGFVGYDFYDVFHVSRFSPVDGDNTEAELFRRRQYGADAPRESEVA